MSEAHKFSVISDVEQFIFAGNATLTVVSQKSGNRLTMKFRRPKDKEGDVRPTWVSLADPHDNTATGAFLGTVWGDHGHHSVRRSQKVNVGLDAPSSKLLDWIMAAVDGAVADPLAKAEFWHEGRCGRCGRLLTVPESILTGIGPECSKKVGAIVEGV